ncbi:MAG: hypothetical protein ABR914_07405 [Dehalococcoidales bacterium]
MAVCVVLFASCGSANSTSGTTTNATSGSTTTTGANGVVLTVTYGSVVQTLTINQVEALTPMQDMGGQKSTNGTVAIYQGAKLTDVIKGTGSFPGVEPGGLVAGQSVTVTGAGGKSVTFTYDQITNGGFTTYDASGNVTTPAASLASTPVIGIAYMVSGNMLSNGSPGPLELGILFGQPLFTDSSYWIPSVYQITVTGP